eukprot:Em0011g236a
MGDMGTSMAMVEEVCPYGNDQVVGIDYCGRFIDTAKQLHKGKELEYRKDPHRSAKAPSGTQTSHVEFKQLTWVPNEIHTADFVLFDFLERLDSPKAWLCKLWESVKTRGLLGIITSSTHWTPTNIQGIIGCYQEERAHKEQVKHGSLGLLCPRSSTLFSSTLFSSTLFSSTLFSSTLFSSTLFSSTLFSSTLFRLSFSLLWPATVCI